MLLGSAALASVFALSSVKTARAAGPDDVLEELRAADRARQANADEQAEWLDEKARLELLLAAVEERIAAARRRRDAAQADLRELRADPAPQLEAAEALYDGAVRVAGRIDRYLDALGRKVPPGLIPPRGPALADPREALDQALHRLERAERGLGTVSVSIAPGRLDGEPRSVEVVRLGGVAAWWRSLDGRSGGEAAMVDGVLQLYSIEDSGELEAIGRASAIAKGRRAPEIVVLPVRYARTSTEGRP